MLEGPEAPLWQSAASACTPRGAEKRRFRRHWSEPERRARHDTYRFLSLQGCVSGLAATARSSHAASPDALTRSRTRRRLTVCMCCCLSTSAGRCSRGTGRAVDAALGDRLPVGAGDSQGGERAALRAGCGVCARRGRRRAAGRKPYRPHSRVSRLTAGSDLFPLHGQRNCIIDKRTANPKQRGNGSPFVVW